MDIGVWMGGETLADKLALRDDSNPLGTWTLARCPQGFKEGEENRLFVASRGAWRGYFRFEDALLDPEDLLGPVTLVFDTRTWATIPPSPAKPFRGFTYAVPDLSSTSHDNTAQ